jgi:L-2-hydroxyglutarate oxidase LhgO
VLNRPSPFQRLIYPVPEPGGLGIHATLDLDGRARFGPDVEWIEAPDYGVNEAGAKPFLFRRAPLLHGPDQHLGARLIALYGIESPGLTASLAIAEEIVHLTRQVH